MMIYMPPSFSGRASGRGRGWTMSTKPWTTDYFILITATYVECFISSNLYILHLFLTVFCPISNLSNKNALSELFLYRKLKSLRLDVQ